MALNSINTNIAAYAAQSNINVAGDMSSASIARLSSGNRIVRAADDVAAMSAGTSLRTNVTTLKMALVNTAQGSSLLQVADGALSQITDILQRQKAIAVQAGAGSLTASERSFLNEEFQNLTEEIDRLASQTNFNGVTLLDGSLFDKTRVGQSTDIATQATGAISYTAVAASGDSVVLNGVTFTATTVASSATDFVSSGTLSVSAMVQNLANALNASSDTRISVATYKAVGNSLQITSRVGGIAGEAFVIDEASATGNGNFVVSGRLLDTASTFALQGTNNVGFAGGDVVGIGTMGDSIISSQSQLRSFVELSFANLTTATAVVAAFQGNSIAALAGDGTNTIDFSFTTATPTTNMQVQIGATLEETLDNFVSAYNIYAGTDDFALQRTEARRDGRAVIIEAVTTGATLAVTDLATAFTVVDGANNAIGTNMNVSNNGTFSNGAATGITTTGVSNRDFIGTLSGFKADYIGTANSVNLSITVGERTYSASAVNVAANAVVRLTSRQGDFFDIDLQGAANAVSVNNQSEANTLANRLNVAFSTIKFTQDRDVTSYNASGDILSDGNRIGSLTGTSFTLRGTDFTDPSISGVRVKAPLTGSNSGTIELDINGVTYRSDGNVGNQLGAYSVTRFTSLEDGNDVLTFRNGATAIEFDTNTKADAVQKAFTEAFGIGQGGQTIGFQVGVTTSDTLQVTIGNVSTAVLYDGHELDVLTAESAAFASDQIDASIDLVTAVRAEVGAMQSRFGFASSNIQSSIQNQDAARGVLLDTDVAAESTKFSTAQVQMQAGIAVLAQANQMPQALLKLL